MDTRGLSGYRLAADTGISKSLISFWLSGERQPAMDNLIKLSNYFDVSIDYLCGTSDEPRRGPISMIPYLGRSAAGYPIEMIVTDFEYVKVPGADARKGVFVVRAVGESMIDEGIRDGDLVLIQSQPVVDDGAIALVAIEDCSTIKRFYKEDGGYRLEPDNDDFETMYFLDKDDIRVLGKYVKTLPKLD